MPNMITPRDENKAGILRAQQTLQSFFHYLWLFLLSSSIHLPSHFAQRGFGASPVVAFEAAKIFKRCLRRLSVVSLWVSHSSRNSRAVMSCRVASAIGRSYTASTVAGVTIVSHR
jgi:hypothetical protein